MNQPIAPRRHPTDVPSDAEVLRGYERIMEIARPLGIVVQSYGGVTTLALPSEQRKATGLRQQVLAAHGMNETTLKEREQ